MEICEYYLFVCCDFRRFSDCVVKTSSAEKSPLTRLWILVIDRLAAERRDVFAHDSRSEEVCQTTGADAEKTLLDVVFAKSFCDDGVEVDGFIYGLDATSGFEAYKTTSFVPCIPR